MISVPIRPTRANDNDLETALARWGLRLSQRQTRSEQQIRAMRGRAERRGILIGVWDETDVAPELWSGYLGEAK